jgi:hypothetical protein
MKEKHLCCWIMVILTVAIMSEHAAIRYRLFLLFLLPPLALPSSPPPLPPSFLFKSLATWYELFEESLRLETEKEKVNGISS